MRNVNEKMKNDNGGSKFFTFHYSLFILFCVFHHGEVRLHLGNTKKNEFSFGISLSLHYLLPLVKLGCTLEIQRKTSFPLVFRSVCTTFAPIETK
jgi:hypothetical protein